MIKAVYSPEVNLSGSVVDSQWFDTGVTSHSATMSERGLVEIQGAPNRGKRERYDSFLLWRFSAPLVPRQECRHGPQKMRLIILESTGWHTDGGHNRWGRADRGPRGRLTQAPWWKGKVKSNPGSPAWHSNGWKRGSPNSSRNKVNASH